MHLALSSRFQGRVLWGAALGIWVAVGAIGGTALAEESAPEPPAPQPSQPEGVIHQAEQVVVTAVADTWAFSALGPLPTPTPREPAGDDTELVTGVNDAKGDWTAYIRFDLPPVAEDLTVASAQLQLLTIRVEPGYVPQQEAPTTVHVVEVPWEESSLSSNNRPTYGVEQARTVPDVGTRATWDVTEAVRDWYGRHSNNGFALRTSEALVHKNVFASRESEAPPRLVLELVREGTPTPTATSVTDVAYLPWTRVSAE